MRDPASDATLLRLMTGALQHRRIVLGIPLLTASMALLVSLLAPEFTATSRFMPNSMLDNTSRLGGLAAQFGVTLPSSDPSQSVEFYAELIRTRDLLNEVVLTTYNFPPDPDGDELLTGNLIDLFDIQADTPEERLLLASNDLNDRIAGEINLNAGLVTLRVTTPWKTLAEQVNRRLLELVNTFNLEKRQSRVSAERMFVEERLLQARLELETAERKLKTFLEENRLYADSPRLAFEADRLRRRVDLRQQVHTTLAQAYEQARIEEVRDTPVLTIVARPEGTAEDAGSLIADVLLGAILGGFIAASVVFVMEYLGRARSAEPQLFAEFRDGLRRSIPWPFRRRVGR